MFIRSAREKCFGEHFSRRGAAAHVEESLAADDGIWMIVEPFAYERVEDNLNPIGRAFYSASTLFCTPASLAPQHANLSPDNRMIFLRYLEFAADVRLIDASRQKNEIGDFLVR